MYKVLKSNGTYKDISKVQPGEYLINIHGNPTKVISNKIKIAKRKTLLTTIKPQNWYTNYKVPEQYDILHWNEANSEVIGWTNNMKGKQETRYLVTPSNISWDMPDTFNHIFGDQKIESSYELGYIFGTFLHIGTLNKYKGTALFFSDNTEADFLKSKILEYSKVAFGKYPLEINMDVGGNQLQYLMFSDENICDIFEEMMTSNGYKLPILYHSKDLKYVKGLSDGMSHSRKYCKQLKIHHMELLYWTCLSLQKQIAFSGITRTWKKSTYLANPIKFETEILKNNLKFNDLKVECATNTFVMNNAIFRNKS